MILAALVVAAFLTPSLVEARRGIVVITRGENIAKVGEVAEELREVVREATGTDAEVGFIHAGLGLFWLDIWTWEGRYCLYRDDQYWELEPEQIWLP